MIAHVMLRTVRVWIDEWNNENRSEIPQRLPLQYESRQGHLYFTLKRFSLKRFKQLGREFSTTKVPILSRLWAVRGCTPAEEHLFNPDVSSLSLKFCVFQSLSFSLSFLSSTPLFAKTASQRSKCISNRTYVSLYTRSPSVRIRVARQVQEF